jgi:hypothetical protein
VEQRAAAAAQEAQALRKQLAASEAMHNSKFIVRPFLSHSSFQNPFILQAERLYVSKCFFFCLVLHSMFVALFLSFVGHRFNGHFFSPPCLKDYSILNFILKF